ncbi:11272_t:CDS:1, partial [Cetraspora pellucida]
MAEEQLTSEAIEDGINPEVTEITNTVENIEILETSGANEPDLTSEISGQQASAPSHLSVQADSEATPEIPQTEKGSSTVEIIKTEEEPLVTEEGPLVTEEEPLVTEEEPLVTEEEPLVTEEEPL